MPSNDLEVQALDKVKNKYLLTLLVSKRVKQLQRGSKPLIEGSYPHPFDIALREVAAGKITYTDASPTKPALAEPIEVEVEVQSEPVEIEIPAPVEQEVQPEPVSQKEAQ